MFPRITLSLFVLALSAVVTAEHIPRHGHAADELHKRGSLSGKGGRATWYVNFLLQRGSYFTSSRYHPGLGNCGGHNGDNDMIIALSTKVYGKGQYCGKKVKITNKKNGKSVIATCVDSCPGCNPYDLDVSPAVFKGLTNNNLGLGVATVDWQLV
ncbi:hypothetical protein FRC10_005546 [Ceratobasidium sp. 414]|nr:hypothetical protein FRC10_005546 [Ceratobasidium sp. 414]